MCLLFFNVNDNCSSDEFRLVLVNNRDEFWNRPTKPADFWTDNPSCISGLDLVQGREGGTWFGASHQGRIGCLVNISAPQELNKQGRGHLVTDFLTTKDTIQAYAEKIVPEKNNYNGFVLSLIELRKDSSRMALVTNDELADKASVVSAINANEYNARGNSPVKIPWLKVTKGRDEFRKIVQDHRTVSSKGRLKDELFKLMHTNEKNWPDPQLHKQGKECGWELKSMEAISSVFVWDPNRQYGTRTTTVLLIDKEGNCDYTETNLQTPVDSANPRWSTVNFEFKMHLPDAAF
ncbi:transport and Golgi organization protein 2 homolog [Littorina saxatilis]|uniref:Uncharacterized protein n=1 Tax=Littorina saxatilis TaxID=31220 RepID=A0AAN9B4L0_9CAEN